MYTLIFNIKWYQLEAINVLLNLYLSVWIADRMEVENKRQMYTILYGNQGLSKQRMYFYIFFIDEIYLFLYYNCMFIAFFFSKCPWLYS
jgi:hypothetical protein